MKRLGNMLSLLGLGWYVGACIVLGVLGGIWLDKKFGVEPVFLIAGVLVGTITAFYGAYKMVVSSLNGRNGDNGDKGENSA